jgi:ketosteroid isomerase-like protein
MSQVNVEAVKRGFDAFNRGDIEALLETLDSEVKWHGILQMVMLGGEPAVFQGYEGVREALRAWYETFAEIHPEIAEIRDLAERVAIGRIRACGKESGAGVESPVAYVVEFKNGKEVRVREYLEPKEALEAAGLSE